MVATITFLWTSSPQQMEYFNFIIKYHHLNKKGIATLTVILRLNKHGLLPMIRVRAQCPTCLCLERSERNDKNYEKCKSTDWLLRAGLRKMRCPYRNAHKRQCPARENRRPVDKTQCGNDYAGNDKLHRLLHRGCKNALL